MKIEITAEQFNLIQNEIIKLENELADIRDNINTWKRIGRVDEIDKLKLILKNEEIDLDNLTL